MSISTHAASVEIFDHMLGALVKCIAKAKAHCEAKKIEPDALTSARLYPDMFPFWRQVCLASDFAKGPVARLAGVDVPAWEDKERTFDELTQRLEKTREFIKGVAKEKFADAAARDVTVKIGGQDMTMSGEVYLLRMATPNFYFHMTTAYDILRHAGVELGKRDFLGRT